ncbi:MAG: outer membrane lipoprotein LolB [Gammaproteobacteria bacterium]|nr:outer membrane lipoprotein LolB [Gammaproteobacteria bacterium]MCP4930069.1 outer membrane lipoprotein LolB [Gammaproteobacteria bacterium]
MRLLFISLLAFFLTACTLRKPAAVEWSAHREQVHAASEWSVKGRMAVKVEDDAKAGGQLSMRWQQSKDISQIRLSGPLGVGAWELLWEPECVSVIDADGEQTIQYTGAEAAEDFMRAELGWAFPAQSIRYWVRGLPDPSAVVNERLAANGELLGFDQYGWAIVYERYAEFDGLYMPVRITMTGHGVRLRMILSHWKIAADLG